MSDERGTLDVTTLESWHMLLDDDDVWRCAHCGDEFEVGDQTVGQPSVWHSRGIDFTHAHCAVKDGYRLRYKGDEGWAGDS